MKISWNMLVTIFGSIVIAFAVYKGTFDTGFYILSVLTIINGLVAILDS